MELSQESTACLQAKANAVRNSIVEMIGAAQSGHPGGSLSAADIITALYCAIMNHDPKNPRKPDRDRFILSKGHAAPALYAVLSECGYIPKEELVTLRKINSRLQGHPCCKKVPGVEFSTGSLGQGLSCAGGVALAGKLDGLDFRVFCMIGDGETQEGQIWEAAMSAAHFGLDNLVCITDANKLQIDGCVCDVMNINPLADKWRAFGWNVIEIDGHCMKQTVDALSVKHMVSGKPTMVIAHTTKGCGVSFMENQACWHAGVLSDDQMAQARHDLCIDLNTIGGMD